MRAQEGKEDAKPKLSKKAKKKLSRPSVADLKQLVPRPDVVEVRPSRCCTFGCSVTGACLVRGTAARLPRQRPKDAVHPQRLPQHGGSAEALVAEAQVPAGAGAAAR